MADFRVADGTVRLTHTPLLVAASQKTAHLKMKKSFAGAA
jgi:hypothetical protein